ncbi:Tat (twin-arginine translocation) pathway signal sequence [Mariniphaga anaerophila]|uniref:Tat (Twin-arginine translocation) pathway signal sequence n=1 Tax=Mariniphaga anaerophila TaxID=1484053 RepID=A0A1M4Y4Z8_9BACT|nr:sugar phosphate isomerase/epimerase family protein [Mariniphaga anaerophila]SHF00884.1 Tat (twin-arginine translocation) pathway signal sequence [Mariniphaga anaerophila]
MTNRRNFLKAAGIGMAAAAMPGLASASSGKADAKKDKINFQLGVASYTLRRFPVEEALDMTLRCGVNRITFKDMHLPLDSDEATIKKTVELCRSKGVEAYGAGVIYMKTKEEVDRAFEYAKAAEMEMIIGVPNHELLEYVEGKVKQYDIKLAIHNHGPGDKLYPSAESAYKLIQHLDKRMGLCIDIGHTKRINRDPEQDVKDFFDRVFDVHIKDVTAASADGKTCIIGRGVIDFPAFMKSMVKLGYNGTLALEYEAEAEDPLPGMMESFGYVKGIMAML